MIRVLLDECLPIAVKTFLSSRGLRVTHLTDINLSGLTNGEVYKLAKDEFQIFVTNDRHFRSRTVFPPTETLGIIYLRISPNLTAHFISAFEKFLSSKRLEDVVGRKVVIRRDGWEFLET